MELSTSTLMLIFFIIFLILSIWKIWAFLPNKQLADDDRTEESEKELLRIVFKVIQENKGNLTNQELFFKIEEDETFDSQLFWRFNLNRLNQLLKSYYQNNPNISSIKDIYENTKD